MTYAVVLHDFTYIQWELTETLPPRFETEAEARLYMTALEVLGVYNPLVVYSVEEIDTDEISA